MTFSLSKNTTNAVKVIAAILVMLHHYSQYAVYHLYSDSIIFKLLASQGGYLGVAVFFFLSGYGLMESEQKSHLSLSAFFKRRFLKVYLPVLLVTIIWIIVSYFVLPDSALRKFLDSVDGGFWKPTCNLIYKLLINFNDVVLWFVKVLLVLYAIFYVFCWIYCRNKVLGLGFIVIMTIVATMVEAIFVYDFMSVSIPYFTLGVLLSIFKKYEFRAIVISWIGLICFALLGFIVYNNGVAGHSAVNAILIGLFILVLSIKTWQIKLPSFLGLMSFDLYLVHYKVLVTMKHNYSEVSVWYFVLITFIVTTLFYLIRSKVFKI